MSELVTLVEIPEGWQFRHVDGRVSQIFKSEADAVLAGLYNEIEWRAG